MKPPKRTPQYIAHAWSINGHAWKIPHPYVLGVKVTWQGHPAVTPVVLVCTTDHYAGHMADHPWDPGDGWNARRASGLWAPNGPVETERLIAVIRAIQHDHVRSFTKLAQHVGRPRAEWTHRNTTRLRDIAAELTQKEMA